MKCALSKIHLTIILNKNNMANSKAIKKVSNNMNDRSLFFVVWGKFQRLRDAVYFAIVTIKFVKLNCLGLIDIDIVEYCYNFIVGEGVVKPLQYLFELVNG